MPKEYGLRISAEDWFQLPGVRPQSAAQEREGAGGVAGAGSGAASDTRSAAVYAAIWRYKPYMVSLTRYRQHEKMEECEKTDPRTDFHV